MRYEKPVLVSAATRNAMGNNVPATILPYINLRPGSTSYTILTESHKLRRKTQTTHPRPPSVTNEPVHAQDTLLCISKGIMAS